MELTRSEKLTMFNSVFSAMIGRWVSRDVDWHVDLTEHQRDEVYTKIVAEAASACDNAEEFLDVIDFDTSKSDR